MRFFAALLPLAIATGALAGPVVKPLATRTTSTSSSFTATPIFGCLLPTQATSIVNAFLYLLENPKAANFNATADALLASDYTDTSDSINQLAGLPVRSPPSFSFHLFTT